MRAGIAALPSADYSGEEDDKHDEGEHGQSKQKKILWEEGYTPYDKFSFQYIKQKQRVAINLQQRACNKQSKHKIGNNISSGESTFMVEMNETASILNNLSERSLILLDEIGRGTSTYDGISIAWAISEFLHEGKIHPKTLFATHYHELTELEGKIAGINNYCIAVKENGDDIVFLRKIVSGGADKSYGIAVARLAGLPDTVIERANEIVDELVLHDIADVAKNIIVDGQKNQKPKKKENRLDEVDMNQMSLFDTVKDEDIILALKEIDVTMMTPMEALNKLNELQSKVNNRW